MGGRADPGLVMTAHVLPCAFMVFTRYSGKELAHHRGTLTRLARGGEVSDDEVEDSIVEGLQGLCGLTMLGALLAAAFLWVSQRAAYVPLSVLAAMSTGTMGFSGTLAAVYGARLEWRKPALRPRRADFWLALGLGLLVTAVILMARLPT